MRERKLICENTKLRLQQINHVLFEAGGASYANDVFSNVERIYIHNGDDVMRANEKGQAPRIQNERKTNDS
jgi:hypothetical protein